MKPAHIAVLMTCYNRRDTTLECLRCLYAQKLPDGVRFDVYLVDDGCTDGTGDAVHAKYPDIHVLQGNGNLYWCGGMRFAWTEAAKSDYDAYLWLNDDTMLLTGAIKTLLKTADEIKLKLGREGIVVGTCRDPENQHYSYGGKLWANKQRSENSGPILPSKDSCQCDTFNGNCVLIFRDVFRLIGNLSSIFTHAMADLDYGLRAKAKGIPIWIAPGYICSCSNNQNPSWADQDNSLIDRLRILHSPKGLPPWEWMFFVQRHISMLWPIYGFKLYLRTVFPQFWGQLKRQRNKDKR